MAAVALITGSRAVAEDCVQEALARAWERSERGLVIDTPIAWLTTVATNLSRSWYRRQQAERRARGRLMEPGRTPASEDVVDVRRALAALPRRQREATVLRYYLGLDVNEVARALGIKVGTAKTTLFRARRALAARLSETEETEVGS